MLRKLEARWWLEAGRNDVMPMADGLQQRLGTMVPREYRIPDSLILYPEGGPISDDALPLLFGGARIVAEVDVPDAPAGVLFAFGDWTGGFAAYVRDGKLCAAVTVPGGEVVTRSAEPLPAGRHELGLVMRLADGGFDLDVVVDGRVAGSGHGDAPLPFAWQHGGTSLTLGHDRGLPVCEDYQPPFAWNGVLHRVTFATGKEAVPTQAEQVRVALQID